MILQDLIDAINLVERSTQTRCKKDFFVEVICPRFKNYKKERFLEICEFIGKNHKFNIFPNLAVFNMAEQKTEVKHKTRLNKNSPPINTWTEETFKKQKYKPKDYKKVFDDLKKLHPWLKTKGGKNDQD